MLHLILTDGDSRMEKAKEPLKEGDVIRGAERFRKARDQKPSRKEVLKIIRKNKIEKVPQKEKIAQPSEIES